MGRLNKDPIPEIPKRIRLNRLHWIEMFPHFPIMKGCLNEEEIEEGKRLYVWCRKDSKDGGQIIRLDVCINSVFRFNPKSKVCRRCFRIGSHQDFPSQFMAEKNVYLPESLKTLNVRNSNKKENQDETE